MSELEAADGSTAIFIGDLRAEFSPMPEVGDTNVQVQVNGTTFGGIYEVVGATVELTSADFGERAAMLGQELALDVAKRMLRTMVEEAVGQGSVFVRDDGTLAIPNNVGQR